MGNVSQWEVGQRCLEVADRNDVCLTRNVWNYEFPEAEKRRRFASRACSKPYEPHDPRDSNSYFSFNQTRDYFNVIRLYHSGADGYFTFRLVSSILTIEGCEQWNGQIYSLIP